MRKGNLTIPALLGLAAAAALAKEPPPPPGLTADQVVERNAAARGGAEAWRKIETMAWSGHVESASRPGQLAPFRLALKRPDLTRFEVTVDGQKAVRVFDGSDGWKLRLTGAGKPEMRPYTGDDLKVARGAPVIEGPLMGHVAMGAKVTLVGAQELEGRKVYALDLRLPSGSAYRVWLDAETFLERRFDREFVSAQGKPVVTSVYFSDYRAVEGLQVPGTIETGTSDGKARDRLVVEEVALNPHLDETTFARPGPAQRHRGVTVDTRGQAQGQPAGRAP